MFRKKQIIDIAGRELYNSVAEEAEADVQIISQRKRRTGIYYERDYYRGSELCHSFPCDVKGNMMFNKMTPQGIESFKRISSNDEYVFQVGKYKHSWMEPAIGICDNCKREVRLVSDDHGACKCKCGAWYSLSGQALVPPNQ